jgi:cyclophilin family peptidyl-prolyl cis-trans isomerase
VNPKPTVRPVAAALLALAVSACTDPGPPVQTITHLSPVYHVDREYRSMRGPSSTQAIAFPEASSNPPELLWVVGYKAVMVGEDGESEMAQEFMCHSNLDFDSARHADLFDLPVYHTNRLFTLSQGQQEIRFPRGFGLPYWSDESFSLTTQVLNLNDDGQAHSVRHRVTIDYIRDRDVPADEPMRALFMTSGWGMVLLEGDDGVFGVSQPDEELHGPGCLPGVAAGGDKYRDDFDRLFGGHWVVKPGREVNRTLVTSILKVPYDTGLHYAAVHLHPFAESLELIDRTVGRSVFKAEAENFRDRIGLVSVDELASVEGIPLYADHEYELVSVYDNTTDRDQDSMAVMLLYLEDKKFSRRERPAVVQPRVVHVDLPAPEGEEYVLLRTNHGEITIGLHPQVAPRHVEQILELARLQVLDGTPITRIEPDYLIQTGFPEARGGPALDDRQRAALDPLPAEFSDIPHRRGTVSMVLNDNDDPNSAVASFFIVLGEASHLDGKYTVFGRVFAGFETLDRIAASPRNGNAPAEPVYIEGAEVVSREVAIAARRRAA